MASKTDLFIDPTLPPVPDHSWKMTDALWMFFLVLSPVAFYCRRELVDNDRLKARDFEHVNGEEYVPNDEIVCDNCKSRGARPWIKRAPGGKNYIFVG